MLSQRYIWVSDSRYFNFLFLKAGAVIVWTLYTHVESESHLGWSRGLLLLMQHDTANICGKQKLRIRAYRAQPQEQPEVQIISLHRTYCTHVTKTENGSRNQPAVKFHLRAAQCGLRVRRASRTTNDPQKAVGEHRWRFVSAANRRLPPHRNRAGIFRFRFSCR